MATLVVYPSVDGYTYRSANETFATMRGGAGNGVQSSSGGMTIRQMAYSSGGVNFAVFDRAILIFDTSALGSGAVISAATLDLYASGLTALGDSSLAIVSASPASDTALVAADYSTLGTTAFTDSQPAFSSMAANPSYGDISITLNASGRNAISKTGKTILGFRTEWDRNNSFGGVWVANGTTGVVIAASETSGTVDDPTLTITYTNPPVNTVAPTISGSSSLYCDIKTTDNGTWLNSPSSYSYQWQREDPAWGNLSGETGDTYKTVAGDLGKRLRVLVTASNADGNSTANSGASPTIVNVGDIDLPSTFDSNYKGG